MSDGPYVGPWRTLPGEGGATLAAVGEYTAAARLGSLTVWRGTELLATVPTPVTATGRPRFVPAGPEPERVHWGAVVVDLATRRGTVLDGLVQAVARHVPRTTHRAGGSGPRPTSLDWSPDGSTVLVSQQETGPPRSLTASAALFAASGAMIAPLWRGDHAGPVAGCVGDRWTVVGTRRPAVFDRDGRELAVLDGTTPPKRIESDLGQSRVLVVESARLRLWDAATWQLTGTADGPWADAALTPDGQVIVALDFDGCAHLLDSRLERIGEVAVPTSLSGVAVDVDRLVGAASGSVLDAPMRR